MKIPDILINNIDENEKENFETKLIRDNVCKGRILAVVVVIYEAVLIFADVLTSLLKVDNRFAFDTYFVMYAIMIVINVIFLLLTKKVNNKSEISEDQKREFGTLILVYVTLVISWGSMVSLMDQRLYGQLMAFMVNLSVCSVVYLMDNKKIQFPYLISILILVIGLPYFQDSRDILIGHYVNLFIFVSLSWLMSRILYHNYCTNYTGNILLNKANFLLEIEIEENRIINKKLAVANGQLKELALLDELTGVPNRRSFREFIDRAFQLYVKDDSTISVIMIDFDFFKQFNDCYGHEEGDKALIAIANEINSIVEEASEFVVRWGGEEFVYAAFNKSPEEIADTAETIRSRVADLEISHETSSICPYITVSLGTCTIRIADKKDIGKTIRLADRALYMAKNSGRNCTRTFSGKDAQ